MLWHSDSSFRPIPAKYSLLSARVVNPKGGNTEFADMRAAYAALDEATQQKLEGLCVHHTITRSREILGFDFSAKEKEKLKGAIHPITRVNPRFTICAR